MSLLKTFDRQAAAAVLRLPAAWRPWMRGLTFLGHPVIVVAAGVIGYLGAAGRAQASSQSAFLFALIAFAIGIVLKNLFRRARPNHLKIESFGLRSYSFPSGHAFGGVIIYGLYALIAARHLTSPWSLVLPIIIWAGIFLVGVSRIYLKSHYPSDVVGGWLFGALALMLIAGLF